VTDWFMTSEQQCARKSWRSHSCVRGSTSTSIHAFVHSFEHKHSTSLKQWLPATPPVSLYTHTLC
jgi:hypothetical protein